MKANKKATDPAAIPKVYEPASVEKRIYDMWLAEKSFVPTPSKTGENFSIVMPPPNVTGNLHVGHAVFVSIQDALIRYHRMKGDETVWVPGTDHAGISTQVVVEKKVMAEEGKTRHDYGREPFVKKIWDFANAHKSNILGQMSTLGASCDWDRERFTFDPEFNSVVNKVFVDLYNKGKIYKGDYIVNWCSRCSTVLSDLEVVPTPEESKLYFIRYFVKAADKSIIVATTRPETLLGDVAVAIHPSDKRYKEFHDKVLILPIVNKEIPLVLDERVDKDFGTGCVKITPAHDELDYRIGKDHNLPVISVIGKDGKMNKHAGKFAGLDVLQARQNIIEYLDNIGNLEDIQDIESSIKKCERCGTTVEPLVSQQWFVKAGEMATPVLKAVKNGDTQFVPERFEKEFSHWMENMHDWCISRQLWWGHRIPAYYNDKGEMKVSLEAPEGEGWKQDDDVLDTWFSSALWPFVVFGWPEKTVDMEKFYPTTVLETGRDILLFWVSRMMMMGFELTGKLPFKYVYLHGMVRDEFNQKMSKSKGNGVEPSEYQKEFGTDATRMTLLLGQAPGNDLIVSKTKAQGYRNFTNKLWNAARFIRMSVADTENYATIEKTLLKDYKKLNFSQKWILSRLARVTETLTTGYDNYLFGDAATKLYEFTWNEFCDWYLEISKIEKNEYTEMVLQYGMMTLLKLWHPSIPYITEEIWSNFGQDELLIGSAWPKAHKEFLNEDSEKDFEILIEIVKKIRNVRHERNVEPGKMIPVHFVADQKKELLSAFEEVMKKLARISEIHIHEGRPILTKKVSLVVYPFEIYLPLEGMIDIAVERERVKMKIADQEKNLRIIDAKLGNEGFLQNAPKEVVEAQIAKKEEAETILVKLREQLTELE